MAKGVYAASHKSSGKRAAYRYAQKGRAGKRKAMGLKKTVKKIVKNELSKEMETKLRIETVLTQAILPTSFFNSVISNASDWYRCLPALSEGVSSYQRIGNKITPRVVKGNWAFSFNISDDLTRDITVVVYCLQPKFQKQYPAITANSQLLVGYDSYLRTGGTPHGQFFNGYWESSIHPVDTNQHKVLFVKKFRLNKPSGSPNGAGVVPSSAGMYSHAPHLRNEFSFKFPVPKTLSYAGPTSTFPEQCAPIWAAGYYYNNNTSADTTTGLLQVEYTASIWYDDA